MKKNILFLFNQFPGLGGVESVSNNIIEFLAQDYTIYILTINAEAGAIASESIRGMYQFENIANRTACVEFLNRIIEEKQIDCIVNQGIYPDISDILFDPRRKRGVKVFSFLHGMPKYEEIQYWQQVAVGGRLKLLKRRLFSFLGFNKKYEHYCRRFAGAYVKACREGDRVVLLCEAYIEPFLLQYGLDECRSKMIAIANPLSASFSKPKVLDWTGKKNRVLFVGRLSKEKQVNIILAIWKRIQTQNNWELVIVGDGEERGRLEEMVRKESIERVLFTGQLASAQLYYEEAKIILLTSVHEGFAMCLLEGQRFGLVPLSFDTSQGVRSVVADPDRMLVPQDDCAAFADHLLKLMRNENELHQLSRLALEKSEQYTITQIGKQWNELLGGSEESVK